MRILRLAYTTRKRDAASGALLRRFSRRWVPAQQVQALLAELDHDPDDANPAPERSNVLKE